MAIRVSKNRIVLESVPINEARGTDIASASTANIGAATGNLIHITGTTTITSFGTAAQAGITRTLVFDGALILTFSTSLLLPTGANITTAAGDTAIFVAESNSAWNCISYTRANGQALAGSSSGSGQATTYTVTQVGHGLSVGNAIKSTGANTYGKAQADSSANAEVVGIVTVVNGNDFTFTSQGIITTGVPTQTAGAVMFLSASSAGALTATEPSTAGQVSKPIMVVLESAAKALIVNFRGMEIITPPNYDNTEVLVIPFSDEYTIITAGTAKVTFYMPYQFNLTAVKASVNVASSSGNPAFDLNDDGTSVFSTTITIDANELFSDDATTPCVLTSNPKIIAMGSKMTIDVDTAGTGTIGAKLYLIGTYTI